MAKDGRAIAERRIDKGASLYEELKAVHRCDPFAIMARFALGDSVALKLQTSEERKKPRRIVWATDPVSGARIPRTAPSGEELEIELIPTALRFQAAKELANYCLPKLAATTFLDADGKVAKSNVIWYVPDNGRGPK